MGIDEKIIVRHATLEDRDRIIDFIRDYWYIRNHVFTRKKELFDECHIVDNRLCFVLGEGCDTKKIYGVCGYVVSNKTENPDVCTVIFQTIKSSNTMLGIDILMELKKSSNARTFSSTGIVPNTKSIYKFLKYPVDKLKHYYRLGDFDDYKVASIKHKDIIDVKKCNYKLIKIEDFDELAKIFKFEDYKHIRPYKDAWCIKHRYYENTGYEYDVYGIFNEQNECNAFIVFREIEQNGRKIVKIIDYVGEDNELRFCGKAINDIIKEKGYEYIDFYEYGIDDEIMKDAGFTLLKDNDTNIIPQYFEPFEQRNIDILFFTDKIDNFHAFRTDAGQDRPNFLDIK